MSREEFKYQYDLGKFQRITPKNRDVKVRVTPRHHIIISGIGPAREQLS
jgi:hypothetical protein